MKVKTRKIVTLKFPIIQSFNCWGLSHIDPDSINEKFSEDAKKFQERFRTSYGECMMALLAKVCIGLKDKCPDIIENYFRNPDKGNQELSECLASYWAKYPQVDRSEKTRFFWKMIGINENDGILSVKTKVEHNHNNCEIEIEIQNTVELNGDYEINGIKVSEIYDNFTWQERLKQKESAKENEFNKKLREDLEDRAQKLEEKEKLLLSGFQISKGAFVKMDFSLSELQQATFLSDDEKRIICGLLPKTN